MKFFVLKPMLLGLAVLISLPSYAALFVRDLDGDFSNGHEGVYDDVLDITWLADTRLAIAQDFGVSFTFIGTGTASQNQADSWITAMNLDGGTGYLGYSEWRLPNVEPANGSTWNLTEGYDGSTDLGYGYTDSSSELGYMYYVNLANIGYCDTGGSCDQSGYDNLNVGPFLNLTDSAFYWTGTTPPFTRRLGFRFLFGDQQTFAPTVTGYMWAVHDGDIGAAASAVPIPATAWLFFSSLVGLLTIRKIRYGAS